MNASLTNLSDLPEGLLRQKKSFAETSDDMLEAMDRSPYSYTFALKEGGDTVGVALLALSPIYSNVYIDTLIIDAKHRSLPTLRKAHELLFSLAAAVAKASDAKSITVASKAPRLIRKIASNAKVLGHLMEVEV